jgi:hypothetical protein
VNESANLAKRLESRITDLAENNERLEKSLAHEKEINIDLAEEVLKFESANVREEFLNQKIKEMRATHQKEEELKQDETDELKYENTLLTEELEEAVLRVELLEYKNSQLTEESKNMVEGILLQNSQKSLETTNLNLKKESAKTMYVSLVFLIF